MVVEQIAGNNEEANKLWSVAARFLESMDAVSELAAFAGDASQLDDEETAFETIASRRMPTATQEQHRAATAIVREMFQKMSDIRLHEAAESDAEQDVSRRSAEATLMVDEMQEKIVEISQNPMAFTHYFVAYLEAKGRPARLPVLYAALLTTAVSNFEVLVSGVVKEFLRMKPEALRGDETKYSLKEVEGFQDLEEFREYCAERHAEALLRGSFDDWMGWFEKRLKVSLEGIAPDPSVIREVFQRRHLFVHNGGVVNRLYLVKVPDLVDVPPMGTQLVVDGEYLGSAIDTLITVGSLMVAQVMRRLLSVDDENHPADSFISDYSYKFLSRGKFEVVLGLTTPMVLDCRSDYTRLVMNVNRWIALKRLQGTAAIRIEVGAWQVASLEPRFKLARLALLDRTEEAYALGRQMLEDDDISENDWATWPLLAEVRAHEAELTRNEQLNVTDADGPISVPIELAGSEPGTPS